ncbi:MAG: hypothetical protein IIA64_06980, partial [Planctomycetes bacterium]|nr:hypothetical protein [Planctomycetota bacterium]
MWLKSRFTTPALVAISFCLIGGTVPAQAYADLGDQLFKLLPNDGAAGDYFASSVGISGETAIVGAYSNDDNGDFSGSAYLFDTTTGEQIAKLLPNDGAAGDFFGISVAVSGATAIVGAYTNDDNGTNSGSAYLFDSDITAGGGQMAKLLPNDGAANDWFGWSVAIDGATATVGAYGDDDNGIFSGSVYLFDISDPANPTQLFKLLPDDGAQGDEFGFSVAISGAIVLVGAPFDDDNGDFSGSAYLFDGTTGRQIARLLPNDGAAGDLFGRSVAISGTTAIVGAVGDEDNGSNSGSAYLFDATTGRQIAKLLPNDGASGDRFGWSVAISGTTAIVGAKGDDDNGSNSGSAYLFDTTTGRQIAKLLANDGSADDTFGHSVAISGATAIVGAYVDDDNGTDSGSAYLFDAGAPGTCPWDVNGDGVVNHHDILEVVHNLGLCDDPDNCPWDVNGDGIVNGRDVAAVATHFGP